MADFAFILNAPAVQKTALDSLRAKRDHPPWHDDDDALHGQIEDLEETWVAARQRAESLEAVLQCLVALDVAAWKAEQWHYSISIEFGGTIVSALEEQFGIDLDDDANLDWLFDYRDEAFRASVKDSEDHWPAGVS